MKNKNGWGLPSAIFFIVLFFIALIIAIIGIKKFGLLDGNNSKLKNNYSQIENKLVEASKKYISEKYNNVLNEDILIIRISNLKENNYINNIKDEEGNSCSGYVEVYKNSSSKILYKSYIKCINYKTEGYDSSKDW